MGGLLQCTPNPLLLVPGMCVCVYVSAHNTHKQGCAAHPSQCISCSSAHISATCASPWVIARDAISLFYPFPSSCPSFPSPHLSLLFPSPAPPLLFPSSSPWPLPCPSPHIVPHVLYPNLCWSKEKNRQALQHLPHPGHVPVLRCVHTCGHIWVPDVPT